MRSKNESPDKKIDKSGVNHKVWLEITTLNVLPGESVSIKLTEKSKKDLQTDSEIIEVSATVDKTGKALLLVDSEKIETNDFISDAFWADENKDKTTLPPYNHTKAHIAFEITEKGYDKDFTLKVYAKGDANVLVHEGTQKTDKSKIQYYPLELTGELFKKGDSTLKDSEKELIQDLYFELAVDGETISTKNNKKHLRFHYIRFVPQIIESKGWKKALEFQKRWFEGLPASSEPWTNPPNLDAISSDWLFSFPRMKNAYSSFKCNLFTEKSAPLLFKRIASMIDSNDLILPKVGNCIDFGIDSKEIIEHEVYQPKIKKHRIEKMPKFEKYYFQSKAYKISKIIPETLDDCFGALASCQYRAIAMGTITRKEDPIQCLLSKDKQLVNVDIVITKVQIYIKDTFDFIKPLGDGAEEELGYWDATKNEIGRTFISSGYLIKNKFYRDWRDDYGLGQDFTLYSNLIPMATRREYKNISMVITMKK